MPTNKEGPQEGVETDTGEDDSDDDDYPNWVRSIRSQTGLETSVEIEFPGCEKHPKLCLSTCMQPTDISPMFSGTQWAGTRVWRSSIVATQYVLQEFGQQSQQTDNNEEVKKRSTLVELGCGLGVPGMILHAMLGWNVVLTDKDPLPKQLEENCKTNFPDVYGKHIQAHELDWSRKGVNELIDQEYFGRKDAEVEKSRAGFDFVINCDCVYEPLYGLSWKLLVETMDELLRINTKAVVLTCLERRKADGVDKFLDALEASKHISRVKRISYESGFAEVQLYRIYGLKS